MARNTASAARQRSAEVEIMEMPGDVAAMLRLHAAGWGRRRIAEELRRITFLNTPGGRYSSREAVNSGCRFTRLPPFEFGVVAARVKCRLHVVRPRDETPMDANTCGSRT